MIGAVGFAITFVGTGTAILGTIAAILTLRGRLRPDGAYVAALVTAAALGGAAVVMVGALLVHDFSIRYVAQVGSRSTSALITVASLWAALEGSILFWAGLLAGVTALVATVLRRSGDSSRLPGTLAVLLALTGFFGLVVIGAGNPWASLVPVPLDGPGPNPLLAEHPLMAFHPPLLYLGLVGLAVPFAITVDALANDRLDARWLSLARTSTLIAWVPLTLGLVAGAWWSYAVLGWGGYWAWDPVENVALLPWLTSTAFLHSAMVGRRRRPLLGWNVGLIGASFLLTLFATLITRSGVLQSVHAFTQSAIGPLFLGLTAAALVGTTGLIALRLPGQHDPGPVGLRAGAILLNNLLLVAIGLTVLVGTIFPLLAEVIDGTRLSVGAPYFERIVGPLGGGLLVLAAVGPSLPWGAWTDRVAWDLVPGLLGALGAAVAAAVAGFGPAAVGGVATAGFAFVASLTALTRLARRQARRGSRPTLARTSWPGAGGLIAHIGLALVALAVVLSAAGRRDVQVVLTPGETVAVLGRDVRLDGTSVTPSGGRMALRAAVVVDGVAVTPGPGLSLSTTSSQALATPAIVAGPTADLYLALLDADRATGQVTLRVSVFPFASWIWIGGALTAAGGGLAAIPRLRRHRLANPSVAGGAVAGRVQNA